MNTPFRSKITGYFHRGHHEQLMTRPTTKYSHTPIHQQPNRVFSHVQRKKDG